MKIQNDRSFFTTWCFGLDGTLGVLKRLWYRYQTFALIVVVFLDRDVTTGPKPLDLNPGFGPFYTSQTGSKRVVLFWASWPIGPVSATSTKPKRPGLATLGPPSRTTWEERNTRTSDKTKTTSLCDVSRTFSLSKRTKLSWFRLKMKTAILIFHLPLQIDSEKL